MRPQRGSWVTSIIGAYVQCWPLARASAADTRASVKPTDGSQLLACASGIGKFVT